MMQVLRSNDKQNAQGMVEFALVLPILLLIIFGIFAFGHLFFTYSSVVIASREAARYGAAVGLSENGKARYVDCDAIRQAAANLGRFAGVTADAAHVEVLYDSGPDDPNAPRVCTSTTDPSSIKLGDRIIVRTKVTYKPIVPLINLPTLPLVAETKRTLIKELPVGQAPTAESPCQTQTTLNAVPVSSVTGELVNFTASLTKIKGYGINPAGRLKIMVDPADGVQLVDCPAYVDEFVDGSDGVSFTNANPTFSTACRLRFNSGGTKTIRVNYDSSDVHSSCYISTITDFAYEVGPADTEVSIQYPPIIISEALKQVQVRVSVKARPPSSAIPVGKVRIYDANRSGVSCEAVVAADGTASCPITLPEDGDYRFKAEYTPDNPNDFNPSEKLADHLYTFPPPGEGCQTMTTLSSSPLGSVTGELVTFTASLTKIGGDSTNPAGLLKIMVSPSQGVQLVDCPAYVSSFVGGSGGVGFNNADPTFSTVCKLRFNSGGQKTIQVNYDSSYGSCYDSTITDFVYSVGPADTRVSIDNPRVISETLRQVEVSTTVEALSTSAIPVGKVRIYDVNRPGVSCEAVVGSGGKASCTITLPETGNYRFKAEYTPDNPNDFNPSEKLADQIFTFQPSYCPYVVNDKIVFNTQDTTSGDYFYFEIQNPGSSKVKITELDIQWPYSTWDPIINQVRFGTGNDVKKSCSSAGVCIWEGKSGTPQRLLVPSTDPKQSFTGKESDREIGNKSKKQIRMAYSTNLPNGDFSVRVTFDNGCVLIAEGTRNVSGN